MDLSCQVQHYAWGSRDSACNVFTIAKQNDAKNDCQVLVGKLQKPYAEFWIGTHVNGPAVIKANNVLLSEYVKQNPEVLGQKLIDKFGLEMPFLMKILSVNKPLSIQAHPNKAHAEELHAKFPDVYKDPNHKPEMLITLTEFQMLRGFRPVSDIQLYLKSVPELQRVLGSHVADDLCSCSQADAKETLKRAYHTLMTAPQNVIKQALDSILQRVDTMDEASRGACLGELLKSLHADFPGDVGCLSAYFLQDYHMQPGEVAFLPANVIHAYLHGECIEIMACSDNVVRGGLTPKFKDVETLCAMLDYEAEDTASPNFDKIEYAENCIKYIPHGIPDFTITHVKVKTGFPEVTIPSNGCASFLLAMGPANFCIEGGKQQEIRRGQVVFLNAQQSVSISSSSWHEVGDISELFLAQCNL